MAAPSSITTCMTVTAAHTTRGKLLQASTLKNGKIITNQFALSLKNPEACTV
jgi:hypothetical protein